MDLKSKLKENISNSVVSGIEVNNDIVQSIIQKTFLWMGGITSIVFVVGYYMVGLIKSGQISAGNYTIAFWASFIISLILIFVITWKYNTMKYATLSVLALIFSIAQGIGLAGILSVYSASSAINAFAGAGVLFLILAIYGYTTKSDLTKFGTLLIVGLITIIILGLLNAFLIHSPMLELGIAIIGLFIFLGLTAYDMQMLKQMALTGDNRLEIVFGISLYLNFINIFIELLRIFGSKED